MPTAYSSPQFDHLSDPDSLRDQLRGSYLPSLGIESPVEFVSGKAVAPVPPKHCGTGKIMILGAYPTAAFERINNHIVPVGNIAEPFDPTTDSGKELDSHYLGPLGIRRDDCWISNLVKVFLFKEEHQRGDEGRDFLKREDFERLASLEENLDWLEAGLRLASPKVIITLGREVAGILRVARGEEDRNALLKGEIQHDTFRGKEFKWIHIPHPGIVMRKGSEANPWPERNSELCSALSEPLRKVLAG